MERERARRFAATRRSREAVASLMKRRGNPQHNLRFMESRRLEENDVSEQVTALPNQLRLWSKIE